MNVECDRIFGDGKGIIVSSKSEDPDSRSNMRAAAAWCAAPGSLLRRECGQVPRVYNGGDDSRGRTYTGLRTYTDCEGECRTVSRAVCDYELSGVRL